MATRKPKESKEWLEQEANKIFTELENGGLILVSVVSTSASNLSYKYRVVLVANYAETETSLYKYNLNYWLATELNESLDKNDNLRGNGCGFDRGFDAVYTIGTIFQKHGLTDNGHKWASDANWSWF
jgi:hypothetical protein